MRIRILPYLFLLLASFAFFQNTQAQNRLALTITPPIIKNNVTPGQIWKSYIKVVNNNDQEINAYVQLVNFDSGGETGTVRLRVMDDAEVASNEMLINNWIQIDRGPIKIAAHKSAEIPFIVDVPELADPGDHHIAFLIGTKPPENSGEGSSIKVSSMLGSLLLLNVGGEVEEAGMIREFSTDKQIYDSGEMKFTMRFMNTGNTILQPQGEIKTYDMWDKEKGSVDINHDTISGNVFPKDTRKWEFAWPVPDSIMEMGKYKAELILTYGNQTKETTEQIVYFWVIKWKPVLISLGTLLFLILSIIFLVRRYVRNAIESTQEQYGLSRPNDFGQGHMDDVRKVVNLKADNNPAAVRKKKKKPAKNKASMLRLSAYITGFALLISSAIFMVLYFSAKQETVEPLRVLDQVNENPIGENVAEEIEEKMNEDIRKKEEAALASQQASTTEAVTATTTQIMNASTSTPF